MSPAVYTALIGGYESLREEPLARASGWEFVCFTDVPGLTGQTWRVVPVMPRLPSDPVRSARHVKICGDPALGHHDTTLWIDNTVELRAPPEEFVEHWLDGVDVAVPLHSERSSVLGEADAAVRPRSTPTWRPGGSTCSATPAVTSSRSRW